MRGGEDCGDVVNVFAPSLANIILVSPKITSINNRRKVKGKIIIDCRHSSFYKKIKYGNRIELVSKEYILTCIIESLQVADCN